MTLIDAKLPKQGVFIAFCDLWLQHTLWNTPRMNCDEMAGDRLTVWEQALLQAFAHLVSLAQITYFFETWCIWFINNT